MFDITRASIASGLLFTGRLILIVTLSAVIFALWTPTQLARQVGRWMGVLPFGRKTLAQIELLISLALRFVPFMGLEYQRLNCALAARGALSGGGIRARVNSWRQVIYPLLINAFRRADHVAVALQARGYDPLVRRTSFTSRRVTFTEWISVVGLVGLVSVAPFL